MGDEQPDLMTDRAHSARMYDYLLGGKDNYEVDRRLVAEVLEVSPGIRTAVKVNRAFMHRAARFLAGGGIRQFLDIGTGIPTPPNLHQVVQEIAPDSRVVYVDNDPIVLAHAAALMVSDPRGATVFVQADVAVPGAVLDAPQVRELIDFAMPCALTLLSGPHFFTDDVAATLISSIMDALPSGSYLALSQSTSDFDPETSESVRETFARGGTVLYPRSKDEITKLFLGGLEVVEPGVVAPHRWRPDDAMRDHVDDKDISLYAVVARKP